MHFSITVNLPFCNLRDIGGQYAREIATNYRKTGNFRVVQFSRNFAVSMNARKLKSAKYFSIFETIGVEELVAYTVAICGSYLFTCGKTNNMQLSKNSVTTSHLIRGELKHDSSGLLNITLINFLLLLYLTYI